MLGISLVCTTTKPVEGTHSALKRETMSTRLDLLSGFDEVDQYVKRQAIRQSKASNKEEYYVDCAIRNNQQLVNLIGKVSSKALTTIHKATLKVSLMSEDIKLAARANSCSAATVSATLCLVNMTLSKWVTGF